MEASRTSKLRVRCAPSRDQADQANCETVDPATSHVFVSPCWAGLHTRSAPLNGGRSGAGLTGGDVGEGDTPNAAVRRTAAVDRCANH